MLAGPAVHCMDQGAPTIQDNAKKEIAGVTALTQVVQHIEKVGRGRHEFQLASVTPASHVSPSALSLKARSRWLFKHFCQ